MEPETLGSFSLSSKNRREERGKEQRRDEESDGRRKGESMRHNHDFKYTQLNLPGLPRHRHGFQRSGMNAKRMRWDLLLLFSATILQSDESKQLRFVLTFNDAKHAGGTR